MNFMDLGGRGSGSLWQPVVRTYTPTRKNVGSVNPSKEQGARSKAGSELPGLISMDSISSMLMKFHEFHGFGGSEAWLLG